MTHYSVDEMQLAGDCTRLEVIASVGDGERVIIATFVVVPVSHFKWNAGY